VEAIVPEGLEPEGFVPAAAAPVVLSIAVEFGFRAAFAALFFIFIFSSFTFGKSALNAPRFVQPADFGLHQFCRTSR
jgi:hypothetical protein